MARNHHQVTYILQVVFLEKKIEALHITRSMQDRAEKLRSESEEINGRLKLIGQLSDLSLLLYSWYIQNGHARNEKDRTEVDQIFRQDVLEQVKTCDGFYEKTLPLSVLLLVWFYYTGFFVVLPVLPEVG